MVKRRVVRSARSMLSLSLAIVLTLSTVLVALPAGPAMATTTIYSTSFEPGDALAPWTIGKIGAGSSNVTWGQHTRSKRTGTQSLWCAKKNNASTTQYVNNMNAYATLDVTLTSGFTSADVSFWYRIPSNDWSGQDNGVFDVSADGGATWDDWYVISGIQATWQQITRDLTKYIPLSGSRTLKLRWRWSSDAVTVAEGMYLDDIVVGGAGDFTAPSTPVVTVDSTETTSISELRASWSAQDPESGIEEYQYSIGSSPNASDVVSWTSAGTNTQATASGLSLTLGNTYYFNVMARNGVGMWSGVGTSPGITVKSDSQMSILPDSFVIVPYGSSGVALEGTITPAPAEGTTVTVFSSPYPYSSPSPMMETTTNVDGHWQATIAVGLTEHTRFYAYWPGTPTVSSARSSDVQVYVRSSVLLRRSRYTVYRLSRNRRLRFQIFRAIVQPPHSGRVSFYIYWAYRGRWRRVRITSRGLATYGSYSYTTYWYWPRYRGYYKARARFGGDANHLACYSPWVRFRAR